MSTVDVVTGAFSYTGRFVAPRLLGRGRAVRTLTNHRDPSSPLAGRIEVFPLDFNRPTGLIAAHALIVIPWAARLVTASLAGFDPTIEEAAKNLGAPPWTTFRRVTLPAIRPGIVAAALFGFVTSFGNLEMSLFLVGAGRTTLPIAILQYLEWKIDPSIAAVSLVQIAIVGAAMVATNRFVRSSSLKFRASSP